MLNILIPASGRGSRLVAAGHQKPKPFIDVLGKPMISRVILNVKPAQPHKFTVLLQRNHMLAAGVAGIYDCRVLVVSEMTEGAACTALLAKEQIDSDDPLMIVNSDQLLDWSVDQFLAVAAPWDGAIVTFPATDPKWSFVKTDGTFVKEVAEKRQISDEATCGIYWWRTGRSFVECAERMIAKDIRTNGEWYIAPVFNELIADGGKVVTYPIPAESMHGLGTPEDLAAYLEKQKVAA